MEKILNFIQTIKKKYLLEEMPFLSKQLKIASIEKPYKGLKILHNVPFTKETLLKLEILYAGGADIVVTSPSFMEVDNNILIPFIEAGGVWRELESTKDTLFDIHMDCAGELINNPSPKIGAIEITGTGTHKYAAAKLYYPVISVDQSKIKSLEGILGTGEAFVRAFKELATNDIKNKSFMIFGYGKVGKGIVNKLRKETENIIVIDAEQKNIESAKKIGIRSYASNETAKIEELAKDMFAIVTATGVEGVITNNYNSINFLGKFLANMGGEDEFGSNFKSSDVMCQKRPINFFIDKPTLMRYLDPVFYAHNLGIDILLYSNLGYGLHPFPKFISDETISSWKEAFEEEVIF